MLARNLSLFLQSSLSQGFSKKAKVLCNFQRYFCEGKQTTRMKVLNVAEKNDAAKSIAQILSSGHSRRREGFSRFNKIYEFTYRLFGQQCDMIMTSVSGHLLTMDFGVLYKNWEGCNPVVLFDAPVSKDCISPDAEKIKKTLVREIRSCTTLIIWTDCDREGENIGFEIIDVCTNVKKNVKIYRAKFSEITQQSITRACLTLGEPNKRSSDAVDVRQELDLRIGAAFTRFQTLRFRRVFPENLANRLISYGSCQFPTLGFVVERYKQIQAFVPEPFWKIHVIHSVDDTKVDFNWKRGRLFEEIDCMVLFERCKENPRATVLDVRSMPKSKWRPLPLETVEFEKICSRKLHINAKEAMKVAEKLYTQGYISYPRTETNIFPKELDLKPLVQIQTESRQWGDFARRVLEDGPSPRVGRKTDHAHPPIHPTKFADSLTGIDQRIYEYIVRHFLACVSKDAEAYSTTVEIEIADEKFMGTGLMVIAKNYLEVYIYERWNDKSIPVYNVGQTFVPTSIDMKESATTPPELLTEADLIALMEKHGIGTDATHAEHIETIKSREYVLLNGNKFLPGKLGMGLVEGYDAMGFEMSKPHLRSGLEADLQRICDGTKDPKVVLREQVETYRRVFTESIIQVQKIDEALGRCLEQQPQEYQPPIGTIEIPAVVTKCPKCKKDMILRKNKDGKKFYIGCTGFPNCKTSIWFPASVLSVTVLDQACNLCRHKDIKMLKFQFRSSSMPATYSLQYDGCVGGCDPDFLQDLDIYRNIFI